MNMFLKALALSVAGVSMWGSSQAAEVTDLKSVDLGLLGAGDSGIMSTTVNGNFEHDYGFDLLESVDFFATAIEVELGSFFDIDDTFRMSLYQVGPSTDLLLQSAVTSPSPDPTDVVRLDIHSSLGAGGYYVVVGGRGMAGLSGTGAYTFAYGATTPVPEPEAWALMLAGLGFVGHLARRGRSRRGSGRA